MLRLGQSALSRTDATFLFFPSETRPLFLFYFHLPFFVCLRIYLSGLEAAVTTGAGEGDGAREGVEESHPRKKVRRMLGRGGSRLLFFFGRST